MHTIKLNISDKVYSKFIAVLERFKGTIKIVEETNHSEWIGLDHSEIEKTVASINQMNNGEIIDHSQVMNKYKH